MYTTDFERGNIRRRGFATLAVPTLLSFYGRFGVSALPAHQSEHKLINQTRNEREDEEV